MRKALICIIWIVILLFSFPSPTTYASIRPIITTTMPHELVVGLGEVNLSWYVIDDNLKSYEIDINDSTWRINNFTDSNLIQVSFSNVEGFYNLTLSVEDYSGFMSNTTQYIKVVYSTSAVTSSITNNTASSTTTGATGTQGFEFLTTLLVLLTSTIILSKLRKKH